MHSYLDIHVEFNTRVVNSVVRKS